MQKIQPSKIIMHNLEIIRDKISDLKKYKEIQQSSKVEKSIEKMEKELGKISVYFTSNEKRDLEYQIKKKIIIKNKKTSKSFTKWLFNNNEL